MKQAVCGTMSKIMTMEEQKEVLLEIMDDIDKVCRENRIKYFLYGGSLIGAVRHKGFIPWDDDIDVVMLRDDYDRFIGLYNKYRNNENNKLLSLETDEKYGYGFAKVISVRTKLIENIDNRDDLGVYVDVFPLDNCCLSLQQSEKFIKNFAYLNLLKNFKVLTYKKTRGIIKNCVLAVGKLLTVPISRRFVSSLIVKRAKRYNKNSSVYVAQMCGNVYGVREIFERGWFEDTTDCEFEGRCYSIPLCYNDILTNMYGNYMELPPVDKRVSHHQNIVYWI